MDKKDIDTIKGLRGNLYRADDYMRDEMSERAIFDSGKPDAAAFDYILGLMRELEDELSRLIIKYDKKGVNNEAKRIPK